MFIRRLLLGAVLAAACTPGVSAAPNTDPRYPKVAVEALPLDPGNPYEKHVGRLTYLGGMRLSSKHWLFGGFSSLEITDNGTRMLSASDRGEFWSASLVLKDGIPVGVTDNALADMLDSEGKVLAQWENDAEGLALTSTGIAYVSFERHHRIMRYVKTDPKDWTSFSHAKPETIAAPPELADLPPNGGLEAIATLDDNILFALSETGRAERGYNRGWIVHIGGAWEPFSYKRTEPYDPTDAKKLPNGDVMVLERRFSILGGLGARLCIIAGSTIKPGARLDCRTVAELQPPQSIDNMEGLAVRLNEKGETIVYMISDDNFSALQRTVLLVFRLEPEKTGRK
jgi:hypothetical protein